MTKRVLSESYNLEAIYPDVAKEWHPTKNGDLKPSQIFPNSHKKVWWLCPERHDFFQQIDKRTLRKHKCTVCSGHQVIFGTSLAGKFPDISKQWHPIKNGSLKPEHISSGNPRMVWWKCPKGEDHEWRDSINHILIKGTQ